jgi:hypothetical protein
MRVEHVRQMMAQRGEILIVAGAIVERDVEVADFLAERKVMSAVEREGEHRRLAVEDCGGAVSLVDVAIDDGRAGDRAIAQQDSSRDRDVVEHAEPLTAVSERVVGSARQVRRAAPVVM